MTLVRFFGLFTERELYILITRDLYDRNTRRVYLALVRTGLRAVPVYLSFLQWLGVLGAARRQEIEKGMRVLNE